MAATVYLLSALTSLACTVLLWRAHRASGIRLLLWSCYFFGGLTLENIFLILDMLVFPQHDLKSTRILIALSSWTVLLLGLI